jgi:hypothetical protein
MPNLAQLSWKAGCRWISPVPCTAFEMKQHTALLGLIYHRPCWVPTLRGWLVLVLTCAAWVAFTVRGVHSFLAITDPVPGGVLVVEGWAPDYALEEAMAELKRNQYGKLFVTGVELEKGAPLSEYKTFAELGAATLVRMGLSTNVVQAVPALRVRQDRTYASAVALRRWLREHGETLTSVNVISMGPHARRTRLLYEQAMGEGPKVGIIALVDRDYDPKRWWKSSLGVRSVIDELVAYAYAKLFFSPASE